VRLKQIKLSGFKSFVDATAFDVPSQLVGVVGPNGCGKSNIMDALRWVLGESKASELRGESMQDVIFNGSVDRKPSVRASVELVFDNAQSRLGGAWAGFSEISVKRTLTRDGQSNYLINGQVVRRKDVHDMFLGTGLGPRAYAIIGQGTVSRIVEAKPDELRVFLEEAAGVSKYKERRRETENRLTDTRENLTRVEDILRELDGQIGKLERQAEVARRYRELETERETSQYMVWIVRRDEAQLEQQRLASKLTALSLDMEAELTQQRHFEALLERARVGHDEAGAAVHRMQAVYYEAQGQVAKLESEIRFVADARGQCRERMDALAAQLAVAKQREERARIGLERCELDQAVAEERQMHASHQLEQAMAGLPEIEAKARSARDALDAARNAAAQAAQEVQISVTRQQSEQERLRAVSQRFERARTALAGLTTGDEEGLRQIESELELARAAEDAALERLSADEASWSALDGQRIPAQDVWREASATLAQVAARIAALQQLQDRTRNHSQILPWLKQAGFEGSPRLWERLRIESGWETAVEAALRERVQSLELEKLESLIPVLAPTPPAKVVFHVVSGLEPRLAPSALPVGWLPLVTYVQTSEPALCSLLHEWLDGYWVCDSAEAALAARSQLPLGGWFVSPQGHRIGRHCVQLYAPDSEHDGILARQHELDNLIREQRALELLADEKRATMEHLEEAAAQARTHVAQGREAHAQAAKRAAALQVDFERASLRVRQALAERARLEREFLECQEELRLRESVRAEEHARQEALDTVLMERRDVVENMLLAWECADQIVGQARDALREAERLERECRFGLRELDAQRVRLIEEIKQTRELLDRGEAEQANLRARLAELSDEAAQEALQNALAQRVDAESALTESRSRLDAWALELREYDQNRTRHERAQEPLRAQHSDTLLKEQAARLSVEQFAQQLLEAQVDEAHVRARFTQTPRASALAAEVMRLGAAMSALGAVNLAALDELNVARERRDFLAAQSADLHDAMSTLEDAIRKIDRETRALLHETFTTVNNHFGQLFPELFGGGESRLVLTGDEILDAGISIVAQPPGKRNQSVHLLSGGEKALTAIALVFALFQLNPAPFCLLDEVDAPLDDANTERYCAMVRRMSDQTQFLFITHNKIAMELAQQLVGVTMQERGVSRIVAVDLDAAARFVEAA
jgi:chromosome segregation protein